MRVCCFVIMLSGLLNAMLTALNAAAEKAKESNILHINNAGANICVLKKEKKKNKRFLWMQFSRLHCCLAGSAPPE